MRLVRIGGAHLFYTEYVAPDGAGDFIGIMTTNMPRLRRLSFVLGSSKAFRQAQ